LFPVPFYVLAIASISVVGIAIAQQNPRKAARQNANAQAQPGQTQPGQPGAEGQPQPTDLGAQFEAQGNDGLHAKSVDPKGAFAQAGLQQNDKIIGVEGYAFNNPRQLDAFLWSQAGRPVPVMIEREGKRYTIEVNVPMASAQGAWLGVYLSENDPNAKGARVTQVYPGGPASRAGVQMGDVIMQINKQPIAGSADAVMILREFKPQAKVDLAIHRNNEDMDIPVVLASRHFGYQSQYGPGQGGQPGQPGQPGQGDPNGQGEDDHNQFHQIPPHAMQLEHDRRSAEQHERIEDEIRQLRDEVRKLRELLEKK
jgi:S1-C subfamily serine protease